MFPRPVPGYVQGIHSTGAVPGAGCAREQAEVRAGVEQRRPARRGGLGALKKAAVRPAVCLFHGIPVVGGEGGLAATQIRAECFHTSAP